MSNHTPTSLANGRYQLVQLIGRGGMAEVYMASDTRLGRTVAVKLMRADFASDQIFLSRFRREARSVAQMNNPNIVNIYDSGEEETIGDNGQVERLPYLVMEYVKGQTLRDILKVNGALSQRDAEQVMLGVLGALEYSHRMGIIHRDIKPGNIMISEQGIVKVMDFGIARALDDSATTMTQSQGVVGTAQYLSPEQARGENVDMRSDLYSAGCVLYEMLTGRPPFTGDSAVAIAYQHVSEVATPPSTLVPGLPKMWDSICAKAMAKDRQNRYATASDFKNDLLTYMNGGIPVAAAFNPLTDLSNMKARKQAEQDAATVALNPMDDSMATQAFNPVTGQFQRVTPASTATMTRTEQRAEAAKKKRRTQIIAGSIIAAIVAIALIFTVFAMMGGGHDDTTDEQITVPTLASGDSESRAIEKLIAAGFERSDITIEKDTDSDLPEGALTKQDPEGGTKVDKGTEITVWFSAGPQSIEVPDVSNMTQDEASAALEKKGLTVAGVQSENSGVIDKDKVIRTTPAAKSTAKKGDSVTLVISNGMVSVPDVTGLDENTAANTLQQQGFENRTVKYEESSSVEKGKVIRTTPEANTTVEKGTAITIYVSSGITQVTIPSVQLGVDTYATVVQKLQAAGLAINVSGPQDDNAIVISMSPAPGTAVDAGSTVTITTAQGAGNNGGTGNGDNGQTDDGDETVQ